MDGKDGRPVAKLPVMREAGPLARIVVSVPAGEGYILLRLEDTPLRAAAKWVTLATVLLMVLAVGLHFGPRGVQKRLTNILQSCRIHLYISCAD